MPSRDFASKVLECALEPLPTINTDEVNKKCNKCLLIMPKSSFNKDKSKADGYHTTCRLCEKECKKKYIDTKKEIMATITEKQCKTCNLVKDISNFTKHLYMKDGYVNYCNLCIQQNSNQKRKIDKENNIRYQYGKCGRNYARKDTLIRHQKAC
jgi:hypothetical protein